MMVVFEVHLALGADASAMIQPGTARETMAQIMTLEEAAKVGFGGLPAPPANVEVRLIVVAKRDAGWIMRDLELSPVVTGFRQHEVD